MIEKSQALSITEANEFISKDKNLELKVFLKAFIKIDASKAKELREKLEKLDLMKIREMHISKIIDTMPSTKEELNKIFADISLDDEESTKILELIKEFY